METLTLVDRRLELHLSMREAARKLEISPRSLDRYERHETEPTASVVERMARLYRCTASEICRSVQSVTRGEGNRADHS